MSSPIHSDLNVQVTITDADLTTIKGEGFPVYPASVSRIHHTTTPYKKVMYDQRIIASEIDDQTIDTTTPAWVKEFISTAASGAGVKNILIRENGSSRFYYVELTII